MDELTTRLADALRKAPKIPIGFAYMSSDDQLAWMLNFADWKRDWAICAVVACDTALAAEQREAERVAGMMGKDGAV